MAEDVKTDSSGQIETQRNSDPLRQQCKPECYDPGTVPWSQVRDDILRIEQQQFGEKSFHEDQFLKDFGNPENIVVFLKDTETSRIVGFTFAEPIGNVRPKRKAESHETAYISNTALDPRYQGHHLAGVMMEHLEMTLRNRGYTFLERHAAVANNYAANIAKTYRGRIEIQGQPKSSYYGDQVFFRIRLADTPFTA